jgi:hypothetical protein
MAEAIGLTASIATLLQVIGKLGEAVQHFHHAPAEILAFHNELANLKLVFSEIDGLCARAPARQVGCS